MFLEEPQAVRTLAARCQAFPTAALQPCSSSSAAVNMQLFSHFFLDTIRVFLMILRICITAVLHMLTSLNADIKAHVSHTCSLLHDDFYRRILTFI